MFKLTNGRGLVMVIAIVVIAFVGFGCAGDPADPSLGPKDKVQQIPLSSIYATNLQRGVKQVPHGTNDPYQKDLEAIMGDSKCGASNIFLVNGKDISEAIKETKEILFGYKHGVAAIDNPQIWVVVFFGFGYTSPPMIILDSVERTPTRLQVSYHIPAATWTSPDVHPYYTWIPLTDLKAGNYSVELRNSQTGEIELIRRVTIEPRTP